MHYTLSTFKLTLNSKLSTLKLTLNSTLSTLFVLLYGGSEFLMVISCFSLGLAKRRRMKL